PKQRRPESNHLLPTKAASEAGEGLTERRILDHPMRHDLRIGFALLVRGSSRRITIVRFRPANIRVINRRICSLACLPCCPITAHAGSPRCRGKPTEKQLQPSAVDRSLHIRDGVYLTNEPPHLAGKRGCVRNQKRGAHPAAPIRLSEIVERNPGKPSGILPAKVRNASSVGSQFSVSRPHA